MSIDRFRLDISCWLLLICALVPTIAPAQTVTWVITDGEVRRNGEVVPSSEWPEGLDVEGISLTISVSDETAGYFRGADRRLYSLRPHAVNLVNPVQVLDENWFLMSVISEPDTVIRLQGSVASVNELGMETMEGLQRSTVVAAALTNNAAGLHANYAVRMEQYLRDVEEANVTLYADLKDEWRLELETARLAHDIRRLPKGEERDVKIQELRAGLESIFELKQQNRRQEVVYLEVELANLRNRLERRERQKSVLVEARLRDLVPDLH